MPNLLVALIVMSIFSLPVSYSAVVFQENNLEITEIGDYAMAVDPEVLAAALEIPPQNAILPEGFSNPVLGEPKNADVIEQFTDELGQVQGSIATIHHGFDTDPEIVNGLISAGILTYIVSDQEITSEALEEFEDGVDEGLADGNSSISGTSGTVQSIVVGGVEATAITFSLEQDGINVVVQIVAVPVGNVMTVGTAFIADQGNVEADLVRVFAEDLALAGADELGQTAQALPQIALIDRLNDQDELIADLEATIAALERESGETEENVSDPSVPSAESNNAPLEILSITTKDAGIGDGSLYAYVEVANNSGRIYSYVGLEGTCRNSSGAIVGTGFGNSANVSSESTVVITMIFLQVSGCTDVEVRFDSLTGFQ